MGEGENKREVNNFTSSALHDEVNLFNSPEVNIFTLSLRSDKVNLLPSSEGNNFLLSLDIYEKLLPCPDYMTKGKNNYGIILGAIVGQ